MWIKKKNYCNKNKNDKSDYTNDYDKSDYTNEYKIRIFAGFIIGQKRGVSIKMLFGDPILVQPIQNWPWEKHGEKKSNFSHLFFLIKLFAEYIEGYLV